MDGIGNIAAQRVNEALQGVQARMQEIERRTGFSFSEYMARTQTMQPVSDETSVDIIDAATGLPADDTDVTPAGETDTATVTEPVSDVFANLPGSEYDSLFIEVADRYGLSPALIKAVAFAESGFRPSAVSGAGAMGLMQLMPYTAEALGVSDPYDPEQNVDGGARLLSSLLDQFDGNALLALAAYNCGAYGVSSRGITDLTDMMQRALLPSETRGYLSNVEDYLSSAEALSVLDSPYAV